MMIESIYSIFKSRPKIVTDSRKAEKGAIFFALKGENFNGNVYAAEAIKKGCSYAIIDEKKYKENDRFIVVKDVLKALQELARHHREQLRIPFIGITGSNGKTTTKELLHVVLSKKYNAIATRGNLNNHIGVPLSVLSVTKDHEIAIIEMGANHRGEIDVLSNISQPDYGIITNIGKAHLEGFGTYENIIHTKKELFDYIRDTGGTLFVNFDDSTLMEIAERKKKFTYGISENADYIGNLIDADPFLKLKWKRKEDRNFHPIIKTSISGVYNFQNILAAICIGKFFGVEDNDVKLAIESYIPSDNRSQLISKNGNQILMDAYNANPVSMSMAIDTLASLHGEKKIAILGDMLELGDYSLAEHQAIIEQLEENDFDDVYLVGEEFSKAKIPENYFYFKNTEALKKYLSEHPFTDAQVLIKGSRGVHLEDVLEAF